MERERVRMLLCRSVRYTTAKWSSRNRHEAWGVFANKSAQFSPPRSALARLQIRATKSTHVSADTEKQTRMRQRLTRYKGPKIFR